MKRSRFVPRDLTVAAVPVYFAAMVGEYWWLRRRAARHDPALIGYERRDTVASLTMGLGSLVAPMVGPKLLRPLTPGRGRFGSVLLGTAIGAVAVTTVADVVARKSGRAGDGNHPGGSGTTELQAAPSQSVPTRDLARRIASAGGVVAVATGVVVASTTWSSRTSLDSMWRRRIIKGLGTGPAAVALAVFGWDFIYYWNHRLQHESRYMWALHVVHHSSERYNLSTALRQPVAEGLGTFAPYGILCLFGIEPALVATARGVNLLYQFWIHTETIDRIGRSEEVLNTPSHHRVHHGSNREYLDRNHGSILIVWDKLFGTFEPEGERVVYGLTKNISTFNPGRIATHEYREILRDVAGSTSWKERLSFVVLGPGWAGRRRAEKAGLGEDLRAESLDGDAGRQLASA